MPETTRHMQPIWNEDLPPFADEGVEIVASSPAAQAGYAFARPGVCLGAKLV